MIYDLHTHSIASDGSLSPNDLVALADQCGVDVLAITDHDTLDAYESVETIDSTPRLVPGIELSTSWRGIGIHIVGLNVDLENETLRRGVEVQRQNRIRRAAMIADRLSKKGIPDSLAAVRKLSQNDYIGRPQFASHLVDAGYVRTTRDAFRKYLGPGKAGDVRHIWPSLDEVTSWIAAAEGTAVLAHPAKYRLTKTKLKLLATDFRSAGGHAIEVVCGSQCDSTTAALARLANETGLSASCGSDFHSLEHAWSRPGRFPALPYSVEPVWERW